MDELREVIARKLLMIREIFFSKSSTARAIDNNGDYQGPPLQALISLAAIPSECLTH